MQVKIVSQSSCELIPILLDEDGFPICLPNEFVLGRRALASNTLIRNLRELAVLYGWANSVGFELMDLISGRVSFNEALVRGSMVEFLRTGPMSCN